MKNLLLISFILCLTNLFAQVNPQINEKIYEFKNDNYLNGVIPGKDVTDSLVAVLDYHEVFTLISNQTSFDCPAFGVAGDNFYKVLTQIDTVLLNAENRSCKLLFTLKEGSDYVFLEDTLYIIIENVILYNNSKIGNYPIIEISGEFSDDKASLKGVFRIVSELGDDGKLHDNSKFYPEQGYMNAWLGIYNNQLIAWGFDRFPSKYFDDFDVGDGELVVNYKYLENGWSSSFSLHDFIMEKIEDIPMGDYKYYGVKTQKEFLDKWFQVAPDLGYATWGYRYDQLNLECP